MQLAQCLDRLSGTNGENPEPGSRRQENNTVHGTIYMQRVGERTDTQLRMREWGAMRIDG